MHAATSIACVTGAWQYEGGGAFHNNGGIYGLNKTMIEGLDVADPKVRQLDQSRIGAVLCGEEEALFGGPPVTAMLIQNTNPMSVAPEQAKVKRGFAREDLFVCVHEQVMTETAAIADIVLPATMFLEHDDIYKGGGHQYILFGPKLIEPPGECRTNHQVFAALADRLGLDHPGFGMSEREHIDWMLRHSGWGTLAELEAKRWIDCQPAFERAHYLDGFAYPDKKFRFKPDWPRVKAPSNGAMGPWQTLPALPDYWTAIEEADATHPFRLTTSPARSFLNSSFNETPSSRAKEGGRPEVADPSRRCRRAGDRRWRARPPRQWPRYRHAACADDRRAAPRRARLGRHLAELGLRRRQRHQHADRRRSGGALWRRRLPRQSCVGRGRQACSMGRRRRRSAAAWRNG